MTKSNNFHENSRTLRKMKRLKYNVATLKKMGRLGSLVPVFPTIFNKTNTPDKSVFLMSLYSSNDFQQRMGYDECIKLNDGGIMTEYTYVTVDFKGFFSGKLQTHREVIDAHAKRGFRYVGFIPTKMDAYGRYQEVDLIFEKEL